MLLPLLSAVRRARRRPEHGRLHRGALVRQRERRSALPTRARRRQVAEEQVGDALRKLRLRTGQSGDDERRRDDVSEGEPESHVETVLGTRRAQHAKVLTVEGGRVADEQLG